MSLFAPLLVAFALTGWLARADAAQGPAPEPDTSQEPDWLIVRGERELNEPMSYARFADVYLGAYATEIVAARDAGKAPAASRAVIGTPSDDALVAELAESFGLAWESGMAQFRGVRYDPGTGFVLVAPDPDGQGLLALFVGADPTSLFACFTVPLQIERPGFTVVKKNERVAEGPLVSAVDAGKPVVVRLDLDLVRLLAETEGDAAGDRELRVARGLAGYGHVFRALHGGAQSSGDALPIAQAALVDARGLVAGARRAFDGRDLTAEIAGAYERCRAALDAGADGPGARPLVAPIVYVVLDPLAATNGKSFDPDPLTGRPQIVLNLTELGRAGNFAEVCVHECLHAFQRSSGMRLAERGMREGTATLGTQMLDPSLGDAAALLWSEDELAAAEARRDELIEAFRAVAGATDDELARQWFQLGARLEAVDGAPSRSGYYVAWLACRAWLDAEPSRSLAELFAAPADDILAALR